MAGVRPKVRIDNRPRPRRSQGRQWTQVLEMRLTAQHTKVSGARCAVDVPQEAWSCPLVALSRGRVGCLAPHHTRRGWGTITRRGQVRTANCCRRFRSGLDLVLLCEPFAFELGLRPTHHGAV
jgi:hypothetical protein